MRRGVLITFEGIEGSGKTSQIKRVARWLRAKGVGCLQTREPGGTRFADRVRKILLDPANKGLPPTLELLLYEVARRDHVRRVIRPALGSGRVVLCDRFTDATLAYQGFGRRLSHEMIEWMNRLAAGSIRPDLTFLLDLPASQGLARSQRRLRRQRRAEGRLENEGVRFHQRVRNGYLALARREKKRFTVVRAGPSPERVFQAIRKRLEGRRWQPSR